MKVEMPILPNLTEDDASCLSVLLADDNIKMLESVARLLGSGYRVVATADNGLKALEAARRLNPDVVLLDIEMPEMNGIRAAQLMRQIGLRAKILFLTIHDDEDYLSAARAYGDGYLLKSRMGSDLRPAIEEAFCGGFFVSHRFS
jgi:DNA-binding NarL/FixJ family response regulator